MGGASEGVAPLEGVEYSVDWKESAGESSVVYRYFNSYLVPHTQAFITCSISAIHTASLGRPGD